MSEMRMVENCTLPLRQYRHWKTGFWSNISEQCSNVVLFYWEACEDLGKVLLGFSFFKYKDGNFWWVRIQNMAQKRLVIEYEAESRRSLEWWAWILHFPVIVRGSEVERSSSDPSLCLPNKGALSPCLGSQWLRKESLIKSLPLWRDMEKPWFKVLEINQPLSSYWGDHQCQRVIYGYFRKNTSLLTSKYIKLQRWQPSTCRDDCVLMNCGQKLKQEGVK